MAPAATLLAADDPEALVLRADGDWLVATAARLDRELQALDLPQGRHVTVDMGHVERLDTAGAWLVLRTEHALELRGNQVEIANLRPTFQPLLDQVRETGHAEPLPHPVPAHHTLVGFVARIGEITLTVLHRSYLILGFFGEVSITLGRLFVHPGRLRRTATLVQMERTGLDAMPITGLLSFLIGVVVAYQGADQLRRFGAEIYNVNLLGVGVLRELGVLMASIVIAGRSGSAFTAEIGTMTVNEEIDALRTLGLDPIEVLVLPRLLGLVLTLPLLVFFVDLMGLLGGGLMCWAVLDITPQMFLNQLQSAVSGWTMWIGVIKAPFFAAIIAMVGCFEGFNVTRSAESVGRLTTQSVVESIFLVIVADAAFSVAFSLLRI
jgi:phospholipid/cholesterol/gamma-HCH transport system permease protein